MFSSEDVLDRGEDHNVSAALARTRRPDHGAVAEAANEGGYPERPAADVRPMTPPVNLVNRTQVAAVAETGVDYVAMLRFIAQDAFERGSAATSAPKPRLDEIARALPAMAAQRQLMAAQSMAAESMATQPMGAKGADAPMVHRDARAKLSGGAMFRASNLGVFAALGLVCMVAGSLIARL
ncbi:MAG: hypothetical protein AAFR04_03330 [Pseudomonadota bacterium]